jgi:hypothetical protein
MHIHRPRSLCDLEALDASFHSSLVWLQEHAVTDELQLTFVVTEDVGGRMIERELITDGRHIAVTDANKHDYIRRVCKWRLERGVRAQAEAMLAGFYEVRL